MSENAAAATAASTGEEELPMPTLRFQLNADMQKFEDDIKEMSWNASRLCVAGGGVVDGDSSTACAGAILLLSQQTIFDDGVTIVVVHDKSEVNKLNEIKNQLFFESDIRLLVVEFEEVVDAWKEAVPQFAETMSKEAKISGSQRFLMRVKRTMDEAVKKFDKGTFSPILPYPQAISPLLQPRDTFHLYAYRFASMFVFGIPTSEAQIHAINSLCADTRWVSPYSLLVGEEEDRIEEDREAALLRMPFLVSLSSNYTWTQDLFYFFPWPNESEPMAENAKNCLRATRSAQVLEVPKSFLKESGAEEKAPVKRRRGKIGRKIKNLTESADFKNYMFIVSMPKEYHHSEQHHIHAHLQAVGCTNKDLLDKKCNSQIYRSFKNSLVQLMDEYLRAEQIKNILRQFTRYDLHKTAVITSSDKVYNSISSCGMYPGLRVAILEHSSFRRKTFLKVRDEKGNALPSIERVIVADPFALSERPERTIFGVFGNHVTFTWIVSDKGVDWNYASHLMCIRYDYAQLYTRTSRLVKETRTYDIFRRALQAHLEHPAKMTDRRYGHYYDQESSFSASVESSMFDYDPKTILLSSQLDKKNAECALKCLPRYRLFTPLTKGKEWFHLPVCLFKNVIKVLTCCVDTIYKQIRLELSKSVDDYRNREACKFEFVKMNAVEPIRSNFDRVSPRHFVPTSDARSFETLREDATPIETLLADVSVARLQKFIETVLCIDKIQVERQRFQNGKWGESELVTFDISLLYFALLHKISVSQCTCPPTQTQLDLFDQLSLDPERKTTNTLYFLACSSIHSVSGEAFDRNSKELCLITMDNGILGYTNKEHALKVVKSMIQEVKNNQWISFAPEYAFDVISKVLVDDDRKADFISHSEGWLYVSLCPLKFDEKEEAAVAHAFVYGTQPTDVSRAFVNAKKRPAVEKKDDLSMVTWEEVRENDLPTTLFDKKPIVPNRHKRRKK